nr:hypothetical protein CFP56_05740 [Quercus suber]
MEERAFRSLRKQLCGDSKKAFASLSSILSHTYGSPIAVLNENSQKTVPLALYLILQSADIIVTVEVIPRVIKP